MIFLCSFRLSLLAVCECMSVRLLALLHLGCDARVVIFEIYTKISHRRLGSLTSPVCVCDVSVSECLDAKPVMCLDGYIRQSNATLM